MIILIAISFLLLSSYIVGCIVAFGDIPESVSDTFYKLQHKHHFLVAMWGGAIALLPPMLETSTESSQFLAFLAMTGMIMVGAAPNFKDKWERKIHVTGASMLLICSLLWCAISQPFTLFSLIIPLVSLFRDNKNQLFWLEIATMLSIYISVTTLS